MSSGQLWNDNFDHGLWLLVAVAMVVVVARRKVKTEEKETKEILMARVTSTRELKKERKSEQH